MMKIALKKKFPMDDDVKASIPQSQNLNFDLDDFDLSDSDREDYHNNVDILFVLDTTGSMSSYIQQSMVTIKKIMEKFAKMEFDIKFSLCTYRDHPPQDSSYVTEFIDLSSAKQLVEALKKVTASGGGDGPEAVMDGLREGLSKTSWRLSEDNQTISKRFLFHICDAPPHGEEYGGSSSDPNWQKNGCPCGTKKEDINNLLKQHKVDYHLIKAVNAIDKMEQVFKKCFEENYSETIVLTKANPQPASSAVCKDKKKCKKNKKKECKESKVSREEEEEVEGHYDDDDDCEDLGDDKKMTEKECEEDGTMWGGICSAIGKKLK